MMIEFEDNSTIEVVRVSKTYDISNSEVRMTVEVEDGVSIDEVLEKDFSSFVLKRIGFTDVNFNGYSVSDVSEFYEKRNTTISVNLVKDMASE